MPIVIHEPPVKHRLQPVHLGVMITSVAQLVNHRCQTARRRTITGYEPENRKGDDHHCTNRRTIGYRRSRTDLVIMRGNEWRNLDFRRNSERLNVRLPIGEMPIMLDEPPVETRVQLRGYRPLPRTRISLVLRGSRVVTHRCRMLLPSFLINDDDSSVLCGSPPTFC
ncbi:hypothetical protein HAX54_045842 [Datura stramonium]|uniref:Uncharacterized protein n=1 Tax=Datura stramonium TaxID=4076 RepID=A0ABS8WG82_DATST|nr:hypothetical protein [Datura stramonium]